MLKKYAYILHGCEDCKDGEGLCLFSDEKLDAFKIMMLMIDNLSAGGCSVYDTKMSSNSNEDWEKLSYFMAPMSSI